MGWLSKAVGIVTKPITKALGLNPFVALELAYFYLGY